MKLLYAAESYMEFYIKKYVNIGLEEIKETTSHRIFKKKLDKTQKTAKDGYWKV